jgi:hypothetical protein
VCNPQVCSLLGVIIILVLSSRTSDSHVIYRPDVIITIAMLFIVLATGDSHVIN